MKENINSVPLKPQAEVDLQTQKQVKVNIGTYW